MSPSPKKASSSAVSYNGPLDWRLLVEWLKQDKVIAEEEAVRTIARCSQAESSQHPLVRLANVAMARVLLVWHAG